MEMEFLVLFPNRKHGRKLKVCKGKLVHDETKLELCEFKFNQLNIFSLWPVIISNESNSVVRYLDATNSRQYVRLCTNQITLQSKRSTSQFKCFLHITHRKTHSLFDAVVYLTEHKVKPIELKWLCYLNAENSCH